MRSTRALAVVLLLIVGAVALAACGGSEPSPTATVTVTASPSASPSATSATSDIYKGMASANVIKLQKGLAAAGLYSGAIDGIYGPATKEAVKQAQTKLGVTADGIWGPETSKAFQDYVKTKTGDSQPDLFVMQVQADLTTLGYYDGKVDGFYGPNTEAAIKQFQKDMGLPVTGKLDGDTVAAISQAVTRE